MSEISLQAYEDEIDLLIEQARYVEALAHLRHLLTQFPHDVSAYYLLGKTMLEADLPDLAVDMFRRALSADSNHLLSRIGLGLAHERRNDLDAALWNLERALESDPSNGDVAEELRRMYGRREGVDLAYVPQTRAGLARLYLRASRYGRAADEFRALLEDQPARPDLMTALAEAYWRNGQWVQAAELCQEILDKLPYSLRANLLLGTLWVNSGQDEGWTYLRRAQEIDPGNHCAEGIFGPDSLLTAQEVHVDRLVYEPDAIDVDQGSAWFKRLSSVSVSVGISEAPPEMSADEVRLVDITAGLESQIEIPDWLRELGGDQEQESAGGLGWMADIEFETPDEAVAVARDVGGTVPEDTEALDSAFGVEDESEAPEVVPDWLQALAADELPVDLETPEGAPDWLRELVDERVSGEDSEPIALDAAAVEDLKAWAESETEAADWLRGLESAVSEIAEAGEEGDEDLLAWMHDEFPDVTGADEAVAEVETSPADAEKMPDWLAELDSATGADAEAAAEVEAEPELAEADEVPEWLAALAPDVAAEVADDETTDAVDLEELPDWLAQLEAPTKAAVEEAEVEVEPEFAEADEVPEWLAALAPDVAAEVADDETTDAVDLEEMPDWLAELEAPTKAAVEEAETEVEPELAEADEVPEWLAALAPDVAAEVADDETTDAVDLEEMPDWLVELEAPTKAAVEEAEAEVEPELAEADEVPEWLAALAPDVAAEVADDETTDAVDLEEMPDWLAEPEGATGADVEAAGAEVERELADADGIPEWLAALAPDIAETVDEETADEVDLEETPDWLAELEAPTETEVEESVEVEPEFAEADEVPGWPADLAPDAAGEAVEDVVADQEGLTGEDAIAWLERLTADYGDEEHAPTDETAQAVGDFEDVEPLDVAGQTSADLEEEEEAAGELLSGDDALAWLESLTVGKEEELRAEAEQASAARVDEILGRKRDAPTAKTEVVEVEPEVEVASEPEVMLVDQGEGVTEPVVPELEDEVSPEVAEVLQAEAEEGSSDQDTGTAEAVEPPSGEGELLSGDDALAWLESLTIGKEEELRAEAEQASADRVAEILGRPRPAATVETEATKAGPEAEGEMTPEPEISLEDQGEAAAETAVLQLEDEASPDVAEHEELEVPTPEAPALDEAPLEPPTDEIEAVAAEDALSWLENLSPEEAAELREQVDGGDAATVIETTPDGERFFGWSAFDGGPEEVTPQRDAPGPDVSAEVSEPDEAIDHERPIPVEAVEILEADIVEPLEADQASEIAEATGADQMAEGEPEEVAPEPLSAPEPEAEPEPAQEAPSEPEVPSELRPEATPSEATESDLDALRAHVKQKRSDHSARLRLGRELWDSGEIQESMQHYARLIKSSAKTDDVMADLQRYADERPNVPAVLRTLGDAYMKFGELDKALEIFNRAMDQL